jgi:hypothetical protein
LSSYLLLAPLIYNYQEITVLQQRFFGIFFLHLFLLFFGLLFSIVLTAYHLRDVSTQQHEADQAVVACNAGLRPEGTAPQQ